ncbi:eukaryotic elongation factor 2 kinase-like isoform X1 [Montipora capricornis]|uniref:eukaryotic elongation factor 2 kinase-like isoform X1 n=1 Tax=Montipora capricornis TaxID=246305 RepID=UPI0035F19C44
MDVYSSQGGESKRNNAQFQSLQGGSSEQRSVVSSPKLNGENGCDESESRSYDETSQNWNEKIGSLDEVEVVERNYPENRMNSRPAKSSKNQGENKMHLSKRLQHHLSWHNALKKAQCLPDPWEKFHIDDACPTEVAIRHRYNAVKKSWVRDEVRVKMEALPFDQGAMRECFRLKKLSNFSKHMNWKHAANYVAKSYIDKVPRNMYFDDVRLQMDAKLWGEEYNRYNPPKKVDIFQVCVIEMKDREGSPLFHLEHFIEGKYIKYNSNSGFVLQDETLRCTPQAFSHFTFERSGHQLIVVDIQGVGDLYTDPQIHTVDGQGYGDANLGTRGMALFFSSHKCNKICKSLGLSPFDLSVKEMDRLDTALKNIQDSTTLLRSSEMCVSPGRKLSSSIYDMTEYLAQSPPPSPSVSEPDSPGSSVTSSDGLLRYSRQISDPETSETESDNSDVFTENEDSDEKHVLFADHNMIRKASSVYAEVEELQRLRTEQEEKQKTQKSVSILGQVHLEFAKCNEIGRFTNNEAQMDCAMFHLEQAAACGDLQALITMAEVYLQLPHDILASATVQESEEATNRGVEYMLQAATLGERQAMVYMAKAYESGEGLGSKRVRNWVESGKWYQKAIDIVDEDENPQNTLFTDPNYILYAAQARLYQQGGYELDRDAQTAGDMFSAAGDLALTAMKGKLANKYYALAEEAWAELDE